MPVLPIPEYRPDVSDLNGRSTTSLLNVLARTDGYGPMRSANPFTGALAASCRGAFFARRNDGSVVIFAGTADRLYKLDNTSLTWTDVSKGGSAYSALSSTANWSFAQFNQKVIAVQENVAPQVFDIESDTAFSDLGGSPPQAAYVTVINRFVVLSGLLSFPRRVQWSGLNAITTWTAGTTYSDFQDLPDGGNVKGVVGGEFGVIVQDNALRRMVFTPGADIVFAIDRIAKDVGCVAPSSVCESNGLIYMLSPKGFVRVAPDGSIKPIGFERVDRTFFAAADLAGTQLIQSAADPGTNSIIWTYKETVFANSRFNKALVYNAALDRWTPLDLEGEFLVPLAKPGVTLEGLGTIGSVAVSGAANNGSGLIRLTVASTSGWATGDIKDVANVGGVPNANGTWTITVVDGTHIDLQGSTFAGSYTSGGYVAGSLDALGVSLDDFSAATMNELGMFDVDHKLGYFSGDTLEATVTTAEQTGVSRRIFVRGVYPITDATSVFASIGKREAVTQSATFTSETAINSQGFCPQRASTRLARVKLRIPAGASWTFVTGAEPDFTYEGSR